jgi:hypothetical protein
MDEETIERLVDRYRQSLQARARSGKPIKTIDDIEDAALDLRQQAGEAVAEELALERERAKVKQPDQGKIECRCGGTARFKGLRTRSVVTLAGLVSVRRPYFYCRRCDAGVCPLDADLGLDAGAYTRRVQQQVSRLCTMGPYSTAVSIFEDLCRVHVSASHAQAMVEQADVFAQEILAQRLAAATASDEARLSRESAVTKTAGSRLYIEMDGVQTPLVEGYNEMKIGVCFGVSPKGNVGPKSYVSLLGHSWEFAPHLYALALENGVEQAERAVVLGDGAAWIWKLAEEQFPEAIQILDIWHVLDRLAKVARLAFGENDTTAVKEWLGNRREELLISQSDAVCSALRALAGRFPHCEAATQTELGYLKNNQSRMDYARYLAEKLFIGSGAAESGCKRIVTQRLKGAGMRWARAGADAMARLRCFALSLLWSQITSLWDASPLRLRLTPA